MSFETHTSVAADLPESFFERGLACSTGREGQIDLDRGAQMVQHRRGAWRPDRGPASRGARDRNEPRGDRRRVSRGARMDLLPLTLRSAHRLREKRAVILRRRLAGIGRRGVVGERTLDEPREHLFGHAELRQSARDAEPPFRPSSSSARSASSVQSHRGFQPLELVADMSGIEADHRGIRIAFSVP